MKKRFREEHTRSVAFLNYKLHDCATDFLKNCTIAPQKRTCFARLRLRNTTVLHDCAVKNCMACTIAPHVSDIGTASSKIRCQINITHFITNFITNFITHMVRFITHTTGFLAHYIDPIERNGYNNRVFPDIVSGRKKNRKIQCVFLQKLLTFDSICAIIIA